MQVKVSRYDVLVICNGGDVVVCLGFYMGIIVISWKVLRTS